MSSREEVRLGTERAERIVQDLPRWDQPNDRVTFQASPS